ncbi:hypothetical protein HPP92_013391 [Vanilla planifolia]|uniref:N-acetyltransferase domain-containing protein n=1 Tax=Vanilla planifolia TaxID=51239 RepID=A0A835QUJ8_VANPL|nr:hypothetical protein HPP92_013391 [Vanilla planifolia]
MLVAETIWPRKQIVGVIRGCVKSISCGTEIPRRRRLPIYTKAGYFVGLRVSPSHRRMGVGVKLVQGMEDWFRTHGAEYAYMATEKSNEASLLLFTGSCRYTLFRKPAIFVHPVFAHRLPVGSAITRLTHAEAEALYRRRFSTVEFFPRDIDAVLRNPFSLGTFLAVGVASWAVVSVWDCKSLFHLEVRGAPRLLRGIAWTTRAVDRALPWLGIPSIPDLFRPFGGYFLYGIGGEGPEAEKLLRGLCRHAHNMAKEGGCGVVAAEVAAGDPMAAGIPYWRRMSCLEDLWCIKRLNGEYSDGDVGDWTRSPPAGSIFVDPRDV